MKGSEPAPPSPGVLEPPPNAAPAPPPRPQGWFHSFALPDETIVGDRTLASLQAEADIILRDVAGRSVLDIGAWDGFFSFEAERRGARDVLATDHHCWSGPGVGTRAGFDHIHHRLGSRVRALDVDIVDLDPQAQGRFDLVLLLGVLYHVEDPYRTLKAAAAMCADHLVVETETALEHVSQPAMRLYAPGELAGDVTNVWAPNTVALRAMLQRFEFSRIEVEPSPNALHLLRYRRSLRGRLRSALASLGAVRRSPHFDRGRVIVHAWR